MARSLVAAVAASLALAAPAGAVAPGLVEVLGANGAPVAQGGAGAFSYPADGSAVHVGAATATARGVELEDVALVGSRVLASRVTVPARGTKGASVEGLVVDGRLVPTRPNTLVPLGGASYLVVLQTAVVPGAPGGPVGLVGIRVHVGDASLGLPVGTELLVGLARAAAPAPPTDRPASRTAPEWSPLGFARAPGHGATLADAPDLATGPGGNGSIGARAASLALRHLGVPYVWAGASPSGFDCSGLVLYVYAQLGVQLPHFSGAQFHRGAPVPVAELLPGDLVFFHPGPLGPGHVGIYLGGGRFVHAPHTGDVVKVSSLDEFGYASTYVGAVRPYAP